MTEHQHRLAVQRAYGEAQRRLRALHDEEFNRLLDEVYEERGIAVVRRATRVEVTRRQEVVVKKRTKKGKR